MVNQSSRPSLLSSLIVLDAFVLGAVAALYGVRQVLVTTMLRLVSASAQAEILNVLDHLLPYFIGALATALTLGLTTVVVYAIQRASRRPRLA